MSAVLIRCQVFPGLFESEYYVLVNGSSAFYVNKSNVKVARPPQDDVPVEGEVLGYLISKEGDKTLVQLPGEVVVGGARAWVESDAVQLTA